MLDSEDKFDMNNIMMYQDGVLWYDNKPVYIVKAIKKGNSHWVFVYEVSMSDYQESIKLDKDRPVIIKKHSSVRVTQQSYGDSAIGSSLNSNREKDKISEQYNPYIFQAPVVYGKSSLTHIEQDGFYEKNYYYDKSGNKELLPTGVFIGMRDITWETDSYKFDINSMSEEIQRADREEAYSRSNLSGEGFYYR